jgi:hypothetical protein
MSTLRKSEVSTEFMALVGFIIVIFISFVIVISLKNQSVSDQILFTDAQRVSDTLASEINFASSIEGYYREFDLPQSLQSSVSYSISVDNRSRYVKVVWGAYNVMSNIITGNVSGTARPGLNTIRNNGGAIRIES